MIRNSTYNYDLDLYSSSDSKSSITETGIFHLRFHDDVEFKKAFKATLLALRGTDRRGSIVLIVDWQGIVVLKVSLEARLLGRWNHWYQDSLIKVQPILKTS